MWTSSNDCIDINIIKGNYRKAKTFAPLLKYSFYNIYKIFIAFGSLIMMSFIFALMGMIPYFITIIILEIFGSNGDIEFNEPKYF